MTADSRCISNSNIVTKCPLSRRIRVTTRVQRVHTREHINVRETGTHGTGRRPTGWRCPCPSVSDRRREQMAHSWSALEVYGTFRTPGSEHPGTAGARDRRGACLPKWPSRTEKGWTTSEQSLLGLGSSGVKRSLTLHPVTKPVSKHAQE